MNLDTIKNGLTQKLGTTGLKIQQYSPEILLGAGIVGVIGTVILASRASLNLDQIRREVQFSLDTIESNGQEAKDNAAKNEDLAKIDQITLKAKAQVYMVGGLEVAKLYAPAAALGTASIIAILASHGQMKNRQVALLAAYNLMAETYKTYRARVVEQLGADVDQNFHTGVVEESYSTTETDDQTGKSKKVKKTRFTKDDKPLSIYARLYDNSSTQWRGERLLDRAFLMGQQQRANDLLMLHGFVFLNQVYDMLGLPWSPEGQLVGWVLKDPKQMEAEGRDGYIDFGLQNPINDPTREFMEGHNDTVYLDFNVDGVVFDELKKLL